MVDYDHPLVNTKTKTHFNSLPKIYQKMWVLGRKGSSGFSGSSTAEQVTEGINGDGLTAIVTGSSSYIPFSFSYSY